MDGFIELKLLDILQPNSKRILYNSNGLQPNSDDLQPNSDDLKPNSK